MDALFLKVLHMSTVASWLILAVMLLRPVLKRAPKWIMCLLWALVAVRLLCPLSVESPLSLIPSGEPIPQNILAVQPPEVPDAPAPGPVAGPDLPEAPPDTGHTGNAQAETGTGVAATVWVIGMGGMLAYAGFSYVRLRRRVRASLHLRENIWLCDEIATPFLLGMFRPKIYLPSGVEEGRLPYIIAHENAHRKRRDHWWKPLGFLVLAVHWFNPLVWAAYILLGRDIELACDEKVIRDLSREEGVAYSEALLACSLGRRTMLVCPLAFGEVGVKERVKRVLNYQKPTVRVLLLAVLASAVLSACFLTDPKGGPREFPMTGRNLSDLDTEQILSGIRRAEGLDEETYLNFNADNFDLMVTSDFDLDNAGAIRFSYLEDRRTYSAQLRLFYEEGQYFVTERSEWLEQTQFYNLRDYLDALRYLPREEVRALSPEADQYSICMRPEGTPESYDRVVTYGKEGADGIDGWLIHLEIQPFRDGWGKGEDVIHAFYGLPSLWDLDGAISQAVEAHYRPGKPDGLIHTESYCILSREETAGPDQAVTVYLLVLHESFRPDTDPAQPPEGVGGDYIPTALTFRRSEGGGYTLEEYWEPRDGGCYTDDIKAKFPEAAEQQVWDDRELLKALQQANQEKVRDSLREQGSFEDLAADLLDVICRSSSLSADPNAYIHSAQREYDALLGYGEATLRYCFGRFLKGGETGLEGHIMAQLCRDVMEERFGLARNDLLYETGQDWFDQFYADSLKIAETVSLEDLEKYHPVSKILLDMTGEDLGIMDG